MSNRNIMLAVLAGKTIELSSYIDDSYGHWRERLRPVGNGYSIEILGADNWTYCPVCGQPHNSNGLNCNCDWDELPIMSNSDVVKYVRQARNQGSEIEIS